MLRGKHKNSAVDRWLKAANNHLQVATNSHNLQYKSSHLAMY